MKELTELYTQMGISPAVYAYGEETIARLKERFEAIDQVAEYNQAKVLAAFRKNRVSATCFAASPVTATTMRAAISWSKSMPMYSTRKLPWSAPISPAAPTL